MQYNRRQDAYATFNRAICWSKWAMSESQLKVVPVESVNFAECETVLAIVRSRSSSIDASPQSRYIQITIGRRLWAGLVFASLVFSHSLLWLVFGFESVNWLPQTLFVGSALAQTQLMGLWLAISPWAIWKRLLAVLSISGLVAWLTNSDWNFVAIAWTFIGIAALVFSIPRIVFGWRIDFHPEKNSSLPSFKSGGTMLGMLGYVMACGLFLAAFQFFGRNFSDAASDNDWLGFMSFIMPMTLMNACCTLAVMCPWSRGGMAVAIGVIVAFVAVGVASSRFSGTAVENLQTIVYHALANIPFYVGTLYLLRRLGWRLYQQPTTQASSPDASLSFDEIDNK